MLKATLSEVWLAFNSFFSFLIGPTLVLPSLSLSLSLSTTERQAGEKMRVSFNWKSPSSTEEKKTNFLISMGPRKK